LTPRWETRGAAHHRAAPGITIAASMAPTAPPGPLPLRSWGQCGGDDAGTRITPDHSLQRPPLSRWRRAGKPKPLWCSQRLAEPHKFVVVADGHTCVGGR
jgi:hypothetical protein